MGGFTQRAWVPTKRRGPIAAETASPGPAFVSLPSLIGTKNVPVSQLNRAPAFSFGNRHADSIDKVGPGPAQYDITGLSSKVGKATAPSLSIHSRNKELTGFTTPAPGDYAPEKSTKTLLDSSPKYTIGMRSTHDKPDDNPAPNVYSIPSTIGGTKEGNKKAAPSYTMTGRQKQAIDERTKNPGAGAYDPTDSFIKPKPPSFTISTRFEAPRDTSEKPGPGEYAPEKVYINKPCSLKRSFGIRHSPFLRKEEYHFVLDQLVDSVCP